MLESQRPLVHPGDVSAGVRVYLGPHSEPPRPLLRQHLSVLHHIPSALLVAPCQSLTCITLYPAHRKQRVSHSIQLTANNVYHIVPSSPQTTNALHCITHRKQLTLFLLQVYVLCRCIPHTGLARSRCHPAGKP
jgi:hypothetical protein